MRQYINIIEHNAGRQDKKKFVPSGTDLKDLQSQFLPGWELTDHKTLQAKYVAKSPNHALKFITFMSSLAKKMDHHPEITKDVAEVTVKTSTFDVKGLTIIDFKLALIVDRYAEKNNIEQVSMQSNFGMHESDRHCR